MAGQPDEGDRVEGEGTAELLDDGTIEIELAYDNNDEVTQSETRPFFNSLLGRKLINVDVRIERSRYRGAHIEIL